MHSLTSPSDKVSGPSTPSREPKGALQASALMSSSDHMKLCRLACIIRSSHQRALLKALIIWNERSSIRHKREMSQPRLEFLMPSDKLLSGALRNRSPQSIGSSVSGLLGADYGSTPVEQRKRLQKRRGSVILKDTMATAASNSIRTPNNASGLSHNKQPSQSLVIHSSSASISMGIPEAAAAAKRASIHLRWKDAIRKIMTMRHFATMLQSRNVEPEKTTTPKTKKTKKSAEESSNANKSDGAGEVFRPLHSVRPIDYFIVFGVHPPKEFEDIDFDNLSEEAIEVILRKAQVFAGIVDRYPQEDYDDCPVSDVWTSLAFPTGILLSWEKRQPKSHFAVVTFEDGRKCFLTFMQFDQPISALLQKKKKKKTKTLKQTNSNSKELYTPKAICIVSQYPWLGPFRNVLSQLYAVAQSGDIPVERYIAYACRALPLPIAGRMAVSMQIGAKALPIRLTASPLRHPLVSKLPLKLLFDILGVDSILGIFSAMMFEHRILIHSNSLSSLTVVCQTMLQLLYPFQWCSVYVPVLAELMLDAHECPQPYIQGVHTKYLSHFTELNDIVLIDLDHDLIRCSDPLPRLPQQSGGALWARLREIMERQASARDVVNLGISADPYSLEASRKFDREVYDAFLNFYSDLCSGFRRFLFFINEVPFFNGSGFLKSKNLEDGSYDFLDRVLESRGFDNFLSEELEPNLYHDYLAIGSAEILDKIHEIEDREIPSFELKVPKDPPVDGASVRNGELPFCRPLRTKQLVSCSRIVLEGQSPKSRPALRRGILSAPNDEENDLEKLKIHMSQLFSSQMLSIEEVEEVSALLFRESSRNCMAKILKQPRSQDPSLCLSTASFVALAKTLNTMLEYCMRFEDYENALAVLESASIFFCEKDSKGSRTYVENVIKSHRFWLSVRFWEEAMTLSMKNTPSESEREEFMLNWLMNASHKMLYYGMPPGIVRDTVARLANKHKLESNNVRTLQQFVHNIIQAVAIES